jgi:hypothetical protein
MDVHLRLPSTIQHLRFSPNDNTGVAAIRSIQEVIDRNAGTQTQV